MKSRQLDQELEKFVVRKLFQNSREKFKEFIEVATKRRLECLRFLIHVNNTFSEAQFQALYVLFITSLLEILPGKDWKMLSVNTYELSAKVWKVIEEEEEEEEEEVQLVGKTDVAIVARLSI